MTPSAPPREDALLEEWRSRVEHALFAHSAAADRARRWNTRIGVAAAILAAVTGSAIYASLRSDISLTARVALGSVSLLAAILASVQAFARLGERVEDHERASRRYGALRRRIELEVECPPSDAGERCVRLEAIRTGLDQAAEDSPNVPPRLWEKVRRHRKGQFTLLERVVPRIRGLPAPTSKGIIERDRAA